MKTIYTALMVIAALAFTACSEENPNKPIEDHDVITTIILQLVSPTGDTVRATWQDADGPGGSPPNRIDTLRLRSGILYEGSTFVYNTAVSPTEDLTIVIDAEAEQHQFLITDIPDLIDVVITDLDTLGKPVGLHHRMSGNTIGTGALEIRLYHYDNAADKQPGIPGAETDVSIALPLVVE
jgi:hypothetical protein